ncbi:hypothetical protein HGRIS_002647 [Hohenbuehelia grisea]|uniref:Uncharacterized protein n=1 Tax=Hohenbuehelia grisea TaxID=104357 RepID=A0ABR3JL56_9AGAR
MDNSTLPAIPDTSVIPPDDAPIRHANPVVAFIIGLSIVLLASILNAAGLNLTKFDHVRTSVVPKAQRRKDWLRPLWLLGMILYIISQLIGSTLALEYMRAEYVAPLGSTSLVFNFLFARFLVGTPVTHTDIYGTIIVVLGVVGIVAFGSINSGLATETDVAHLTVLWRRGGWLGYFFLMSFTLILLYIFTSRLDAVLSARSEINSVPFAGMAARASASTTSRPKRAGSEVSVLQRVLGLFAALGSNWEWLMLKIGEWLEHWTAAQDDKQIAWTLGIGWACCGGGLAGGCLVFAKASVQLISGSLSRQNTGNQFGHAAPIFTFILLAITAVLQIICLNRGLKAYDSTLVVPVFYGVYTAVGFLNSLIFNNEVDSYQSWTLFLIFVSILILISGVVLLTHKKPEPIKPKNSPSVPNATRPGVRKAKQSTEEEGEEGEEHALHTREVGEEGEAFWSVGDVSDDEDEDANGPRHRSRPADVKGSTSRLELGDEGVGLMDGAHEHDESSGPSGASANKMGRTRRSTSSEATLAVADPFREDTDEFGSFNGGSFVKINP